VTRRDLRLVAPAAAVLALLFGGAVAGLVRTSLVPLGGGVTLDAWRGLAADPAFADALWFSLRITALSTVLAAVVALALAGPLRRCGPAVRTLASLPLPVPHLLVAITAVLWLGPGGLAERVLGAALPAQVVRDGSGAGIVLVYAYKEAPFLLVLLLAAMGRGLEERAEAAAVLGASPWQRARWVVWPTVRGPLVVGSIVVAAFVLGAFEVPLTVGPNDPLTLAVYAAEATQGSLLGGEGARAAALLVTSALACVLAGLAVRFARDAEGG
jgi:putative spermidine/putrescine transport system permease protein